MASDKDKNGQGQYFNKRPNTKAPKLYGKQDKKPVKMKLPADGGAPKTSAPPLKSTAVNKRPANVVKLRPQALITAGIIVAVLLLLVVTWACTRKNAYEVYVSGNLEGVIAKNKEVTEKTIYDTAVAKLQREVGGNVAVNEEVTFVPVHAGKKSISNPDYIIGNIYKKWPYQVESSVITLNGVEMAAMAGDQDVDAVLKRLGEQYIAAGATMVGTPTCDDIAITKKFVSPEDVVPVETAYALLNGTTEKTVTYSVRSGDNLGKIAAEAGMTLDELLAANTNLDVNSRLSIGQPLNLKMKMPLVNITTVEETTHNAAIPKEVETRENPSEHISYSKVIQAGKDGEKEVTEQTTRTNGTPVKTEQVSENILTPPTTEIVEVGTSNVITAR